MGGLGFALPAAAGVRMARAGPAGGRRGRRRLVPLPIQALWSAAAYGCGVLFVVLRNGGYAIMDRLAERAGGTAPWPAFDDVSIAGLATSLG